MALSYSTLARRCDYHYSWPGDWLSLYDSHNPVPISSVDNYKNWRAGWCYLGYGANTNYSAITWLNNSNQSSSHLFANVSPQVWPFFNVKGEIHPTQEHNSTHYNRLAVIRWTPPFSGEIRVSGFVQHAQDASRYGGDGIALWMYTVNPNTHAPWWGGRQQMIIPDIVLQPGTKMYHSFNITFTPNANTQLYLVVGCRNGSAYDSLLCNIDIRYTNLPSTSTLSLKKSVIDQGRHYNAFPWYFQNNLAWNNNPISFGDLLNSFTPPNVVRIAGTRDTYSGTTNGNGTLTVKAVNVEQSAWIIRFRMTVHLGVGNSNTGNDTNRYSGTYLANSNNEYTFTQLTGGLYGIGVTVQHPTNGWYKDISISYIHCSDNYVERNLLAD